MERDAFEILKLSIEIDGQVISADCGLGYSTFLSIGLEGLYKGINLYITPSNGKEYFDNREDAIEQIINELHRFVALFEFVKTNKEAYKMAYSAYMESYISTKESGESYMVYEDVLCKLLNISKKNLNRYGYLVMPYLLKQILSKLNLF